MAAPATAEERAAVDALLGAPRSQWEGGERIDPREGHVGYTGAAVRARRHLLLPAHSHSEAGLMRASLDMRMVAAKNLRFTTDQATLMLERLTAPPVVSTH